ncbi:MAG: porin [Usitatibacter sp.]
MNKKLIALAVAGACVAPTVMAQTANPVTLYGRAYATFESVEADGGPSGTATVPRRSRVSDQSSLLGVRGTEDLGGGLKAFFQLETGFRLDDTTTGFAQRNSGVGLQGNAWGSIMMGRWDTPYKATTLVVDPYGDLTFAGFTSGVSGNGVRNVQGSTNLDRRDQNVVQYWSPSWGGVAIRASYSANEAKTATLNPSKTSASVTYTGGPVYVGYAWDEQKDTAFSTFTMRTMTGQAAFGTLTFGPIKLGGLYDEFKKDSGTSPGWNKQKQWLANITYTIGNHQLIYQYTDSKDGELSTVAQPHCKIHAPGYQYNFSRRTYFLAQYVKIDNNDTSTCNFGANPLTIVAGQDLRGISLGLRHVF